MAAVPSLEELLRGVAPEKLDQACRDDHLSEMALSLTGWQSITPLLGLSEVDEEAIVCRYPQDLVMQNIAMLRKWKNKFGQSATYRKLAQVFFSRGKCDTIDKLRHILLQENAVSTSQLPANSYADYLRGRYRTQIPTFLTLQWPPPPTRHVFNLAMIRGQNIRYGIDDDMVRLMLRGRVSDVVKQKKPVKLEDIFLQDSAERKVILIEGGPGSGKSTLAWHVCQKWASGELFREFKAVVFVQLRDPAIQSARSVEAILPVESRGQAARVVAEFQACRGQGMLWVMDGWDELPSCLYTSSIFQRLIVSPETENVHFSAVVITSRPIASGDLHPVVSSRVEILGFTPTEVRGYFTEAVGGDSQTVQNLQDQLRERPVIEASCYVPLNAAIVTHLFLTQNQSLPTTLHGVFTSLVLCCLIRHATKEGKTFGDISSLDNLPPYFQEPLEKICALAYHGVMKNKVTFSAEELEPLRLSRELATLDLIQGVESLALFKKSVSFNFLHLSVQELLAAFYISKLPPSEQVKVFNTMFGQPRFAAVFQFYAAFTKLETEGIREIIAKIATDVEHSIDKSIQLLYLLRGLYEAQDLSLCQFVGSQLGRRLKLYGTPLSPVDCLSAGYFISCVCLTTSGEFRVNLRMCLLDDYRVSLLVKELSKCCSTVTEAGVPGCVDLDLGYNSLQGSGICCIAELISHSTLISKLYLHGNSIRYGEDALYGLRHLSQALMTNTSLVELDVGEVGITAEGVEVLAKALVVNEHLETLIIAEAGLSLDPLHRILSGRPKPLDVAHFVNFDLKRRPPLPPTTPSPPPAFAIQGHRSRRKYSSPPGVLRASLASPGAVPFPGTLWPSQALSLPAPWLSHFLAPPPPLPLLRVPASPSSPHPDSAAWEGSRGAEISLRLPAVRRRERKVLTKRVALFPASPPILTLPSFPILTLPPFPSPLPPRPEARQAPLPHPLPPSEVSRSLEGTLTLDGERQKLSPLPRGPLRLQEAREAATRSPSPKGKHRELAKEDYPEPMRCRVEESHPKSPSGTPPPPQEATKPSMPEKSHQPPQPSASGGYWSEAPPPASQRYRGSHSGGEGEYRHQGSRQQQAVQSQPQGQQASYRQGASELSRGSQPAAGGVARGHAHQAAPPNPQQADNLLDLLRRYPVMWQGHLMLQNESAAVQLHFLSGNVSLAKLSLPQPSEQHTPCLRIAQSMRLEQTQLEGVYRRIQNESEHCLLLALPCGRDANDVRAQTHALKNSLISYLLQKQAAGIINVQGPQTGFVLHIFPPCPFSQGHLSCVAPDLLSSASDNCHLMIVVATM